MTEREGFLDRPGGERLAWRALDGDGPTVVWLGGYRSDMGGSKAEALAAAARERSWSFLRFDYFAHGQSSGRWEDATIGRWREDALATIDALSEGPLLLVGSSMGGWMACLTALARPERVKGMVLIAPAPDFTERLMRPKLAPEAVAALERDGFWMAPSFEGAPYVLTRRFLDEGSDHNILTGRVAIDCPVRILQGQRDVDVPWEHALMLADKLVSEDVELTLVKAGDHRLSGEADLRRLVRAVEALRAAI